PVAPGGSPARHGQPAQGGRLAPGWRRGSGARLLAGACLVGAFVGTASGPTWATAALHRHRAPASSSTTTTTVPGTTTTVPTMPLPMPPPPAPEDTCVKGAWMPAVRGRPASFAMSNGAYLWHDPDGGWALRVTHAGPGDRAAFSGSLTSAHGQFVDITALDGGNDIVYETHDKHTVYFRLVDFQLLDGLNFATQCSAGFQVKVHIGAKLLGPRAVRLGSDQVKPASNPFKVARDHTHGQLTPTAAVKVGALGSTGR
ncbi:MAG: hypothetical protein ACRDZX_15265, partial [Acidimicrobiales bacterium]